MLKIYTTCIKIGIYSHNKKRGLCLFFCYADAERRENSNTKNRETFFGNGSNSPSLLFCPPLAGSSKLSQFLQSL